MDMGIEEIDRLLRELAVEERTESVAQKQSEAKTQVPPRSNLAEHMGSKRDVPIFQYPSEVKGKQASSRETSNQSDSTKAISLKDEGNALFKKGQYRAAADKYTMAIELDPDNSVLRANRAMAYLKLKRYKQAEADCSEALTIDPKNAKALLRRASARLELGQLTAAHLDCQAVLRLEPKNQQAMTMLDRTSPSLPAVSHQSKPSVLERAVNKHASSLSSKNTAVSPTISTAISANVSGRSNQPKKPEKALATSKPQLPAPKAVAMPLPKAPPKSSYDLELAWRQLADDPVQWNIYFRGIEPATYKAVFSDFFSNQIFSGILQILRDYYISDNGPVYNVLDGLASVRRFSIVNAMMSPSDKTVFKELLAHISRTESLEKAQQLATKYGVDMAA